MPHPLLTAAFSTLLLLAGPALAAKESSPEARQAISQSTGAVLRGDSRNALAVLRAVPVEAFDDTDAAYRACMIERFDRSSPPPPSAAIEDPFVRDVLAAYQQYWWRALAAPAGRTALEADLFERLRTLLGEHGRTAKDFDALEAPLQAQLQAHGYHALLGLTAPLRELMLWRTQTTRQYPVALPEGVQSVNAQLLDDFASLGWSAYGRCERGSNGGWATQEAVFAVVPSYKEGLDSEAFRVVFLAHEAQHFADKRRFGSLENWELEYRAKLVELVYAGEALGRKRLQGFITAQGDDPGAPHPYANARLVRELTSRLGMAPDQAPLARLQAAARDALLDDSKARVAKMAGSGGA
ncbi:hypothetical protein [Agrilutibacter solisilvae]|uniref:DUF2268 domain-containing protein n=1 Tax=Agrilutibacter solisilvae TaxID=2763317 RepID=A0A974Y170_9GAMM|nr:hypothetical protein [Lysobacter solisilvae]QSX78680.1 hypothetical protein I8J32_001690 [Lysobacter solisilvae]